MSRRVFWAAIVLIGIGAGVALLADRSASHASPLVAAPAAAWAAHKEPAPNFTLRDQHGKSVSLAAFRGRAVVVTFVDPRCRNVCPVEAAQLMAAVRGTNTPVISVSTNPYGNARRYLLQDDRKWQLTSQWHWAVGPWAQLRQIWKRYAIAVLVDPKTHDVTHTLASYVLDANGDERALFVWPYRADAVTAALKHIS